MVKKFIHNISPAYLYNNIYIKEIFLETIITRRKQKDELNYGLTIYSKSLYTDNFTLLKNKGLNNVSQTSST